MLKTLTMFLIKSLISLLLILFLTNSCLGFLEVAVGFASYLYQKTSCSTLGYCCTEREIPADFEALRKNIKSKIYGQPLIEKTIVNAIKSHWSLSSDKALTLSLHGGPGVGKNYVSKFITEALYLQGMKSPHVHHFNARLDFPEETQVHIYKKNLADWIRGNVSKCPKQLFVFDEVHQMPAGVLDILKPFIDYITYVNGIDYRKSIFIFLSNTGSTILNKKAYDLWNMGIERDNMKMDVFERIIAQGAFNEKGGFHHSDTIKMNLIDHYVPFLPLTKPHVELCIKEEFRKSGVDNPTEKQIQEVLDFIDWGPDLDHEVFAKTGCKRISQKVRVLAI